MLSIDGHYLNLPVMSEAGEIVGMVDVLKLTYATLDQINSMSTGDSEGPAWNKFWLSLDAENETESMVSGEGSRMPRTPDVRSLMSPDGTRSEMDRMDNVMPNESASHHGGDLDDIMEKSAVAGIQSLEDIPFTFKFKAPNGRMHRLQVVASNGMEELIASIVAKLGGDVSSVGGEPSIDNGSLGKSGFALSYLDNEGDTVSITTNHDLVDAITLARNNRRDKVDLFVHDPEQPPLSATLDPHPGPGPIGPPTPAESVVNKRIQLEVEESEDEPVAKSKSKTSSKAKAAPQQILAGVPNEVLLPGVVAGLAVVIVAVFALGRSTAAK